MKLEIIKLGKLRLLFLIIVMFFITNTLSAHFIYEDKSNLSIEEIIANKTLFKKTDKITFGINNNTYWLKIDLKNNSKEVLDKYILFDFSLLKSLTAYSLEDGKINIKRNGYSVLNGDKEIKINDLAFKYKLKANEEKIVFIKVKNDLANILSYKIYDEDDFLKVVKNRTIIEIAILSGLLILFFYYIFIALSLKNRIYFLYLGYLIGTILFFSNLTNLLNYIDFLNQFRNEIHIISVGFICLFSLLFLNEFKLNKYPPFVNIVFKIGVVFSFIFVLGGLFDSSFIIDLSKTSKKILIAAIVISISIIIIYYIIKKYKESFYLAIAWSVFITGSVFQILLVTGNLNNSIFRYSIGIGALFVAILYSLILAKNYKFAQAKKIEWKDKYLRELETQNKEKDRIVDENVIYSITDLNGIITEVSQAFCKISGYTKNELIGQSHNIVGHPDTPKSTYNNLWEIITNNQSWEGELKNKKKNGDFYWVYVKIYPIYKENKKVGYSALKENITDKKRLEEISITDELTQIYNRRYFNEMFIKFIDVAKRNNELINFIIFDVDHFKQYNDEYGHLKGDKVLKEIADIVKNSLKRGNDYCFRLGGEEFGILFNSKSKANSVIFANKIKENIEQLKIEHKKNSASSYVTASFGLCIEEAKNIDCVDDIYKNADILLYEAKEKGRNRVIHNYKE